MTWHKAVNAVLFQLTWFACVLGGAAGSGAWGALAVVVLAAHALRAGPVARDLMLAAAAAPIGFALDTAWIHLGILDYAGAALAPAWIVMLWVAVALTLNHCLAWLQRRPWLGGVLAGLSAPLSYLAGAALGAVHVPDARALLAVGLLWWPLFALGLYAAGVPGRRPARREYERAH